MPKPFASTSGLAPNGRFLFTGYTPVATTEHTINDAIAELLRGTRRAWRDSDIVSSENTGQLKGTSGRPDILVVEPNVSPVVIETEVLPAITVEAEALDRLGAKMKATGRMILSSIAVRLPLRLRDKSGKALQKDLLGSADLEMVLYTGSNASKAVRFPLTGWMVGSIADLSILTQAASVPPDVIDAAANNLADGVSESAGMLAEMAKAHAGAIHKISEELFQEDGEQTRRMAATILVNAFVFQETLAGGSGELANIASLEELREAQKLNKNSILKEWEGILKINYYPIFDIAKRILTVVPTAESKQLIDHMVDTANKLLENRLMRSHDLTGAVFQRMIVDRKFLAAYYTTPSSAALLIGLAITPTQMPSNTSWGKPEDVKALRIADFACGTGTLLTTTYQRIGQLHELAGGDSEALHSDMMSGSLIGCDILPAATHLTASMLSGAHPTVTYKQSSILTVGFGKLESGALALGSIDLLEDQRPLEVLDITAQALGGLGQAELKTWAMLLPHASFDMVVMNPPFVRPTGHEGDKVDVPVPMFAAFKISDADQRTMSKMTSKLIKGTSANGQAGEASIFLVVADRKLKVGGTLALVMPLSLMLGDSWDKSRILLSSKYSDLILISIAGREDKDMSFSADTDYGECLVSGRKTGTPSARGTFVVLKERPTNSLMGASAATQIHRLIAGKKLRNLEDGPVGGTLLHFGDDVIGQAVEAPLPASGVWNLARIADISLAQTAYQLWVNHVIWLPAMSKSNVVAVPIATIEKIATIGPYHMDVQATTATGGLRGPFSVVAASKTPTYPVIWEHDADRERAMCFDAESEGRPLKGKDKKEQELIDEKAAKIWFTASHSHFNRDFRFNSQSTAMQFTPRKSIGGRAWLSVSLESPEQEKALVLWANTSLGLLLYWWHANKQQSGRGTIGKEALHDLCVLDVTALTADQLKRAVKVFDEMCYKEMLQFHEIDKDPVRKELDERFAREVLGVPESVLAPGGALDVLRMKLAQEPSIRGNK
jgi:predicted RNA methylase